MSFRFSPTEDNVSSRDFADPPKRSVKVHFAVGSITLGVEQEVETKSAEIACQAVYEIDEEALLGQRLVLTPYMLLDELKQCQEEMEQLLAHVDATGLGLERRCGVMVNPVAERMERVHFGVSHLLKLLWRSGLWTDEEVREASAADGKPYRVLCAPFTDGKPRGRDLSPNAPLWQRELLGLPPVQASHAPPRLTLAVMHFNNLNNIHGSNGYHSDETSSTELAPEELEEELEAALRRAA